MVIHCHLTFLRQGQVCFLMHLYGKKHLKILFSKTKDGLWLNLCIYHLERAVYQSCYNNCHTLTFNLFKARSSLLLYAFVWAPYICMEKMLIISNGFSSEASRPVLLKFHAEPPWAGEWKLAKMGMVHWSKWLPCPYMVKTFKNLFLHNQISPGS